MYVKRTSFTQNGTVGRTPMDLHVGRFFIPILFNVFVYFYFPPSPISFVVFTPYRQIGSSCVGSYVPASRSM